MRVVRQASEERLLAFAQGQHNHAAKDTVDVKVLLEFLRTMHNTKEVEALHVKNHIEMLDRDIRQVLAQPSTLCFGHSSSFPCALNTAGDIHLCNPDCWLLQAA